MSRRIDGDPLAIGAVDAPVVMVAYSDYRCPFCASSAGTSKRP
nr:DsbA family protein [Rhodococcus pyridinivorans]